MNSGLLTEIRPQWAIRAPKAIPLDAPVFFAIVLVVTKNQVGMELSLFTTRCAVATAATVCDVFYAVMLCWWSHQVDME
jgi:hypothetical protein